MDTLFDLCVELLKYIAAETGTTYKEINVIIFIYIGPVIMAGSFFLNIFQYIRYLQRKSKH